MTYIDMPVIIPILATGYLLTVYLLLMLAQRTTKSSQYATHSITTDAYASYVPTDRALQIDEEVERRWSLRLGKAASLALPNRTDALGDVAVASKEPLPEPRSAMPLVQQADDRGRGLANSSAAPS
jgi:hypothetical protein